MNPEPRGLLLLAATIAVAFVIVGAQRGDPDQTRTITSYIDAHNAEALTLLERLVNINSGTHNFDGVREVGRILRAELDGLGFTTAWVDGAAWQRAGHLVAERPGRSGAENAGDIRPRVLLIGHLD